MNKYEVPIWQKSNLTIEEAAEYTNIGKGKIRELIQIPKCDFVLYVGKKALIKRKNFDEYLNNQKFI